MLRSRPTPYAVFGAILLALVGVVAACGETPVEQRRARLGTASLALVDSTGEHQIADVEAAFYVYDVGPGDDERAMYLLLATPSRRPSGVELELFQFLPDLQETPLEGTFLVGDGTLSGTRAMGGDLRVWRDATLKQFVPAGGDDSISVSIVAPDTVTGRLHLTMVEPYRGRGSVTVRGSFTAVRVARFDELPRAR